MKPALPFLDIDITDISKEVSLKNIYVTHIKLKNILKYNGI